MQILSQILAHASVEHETGGGLAHYFETDSYILAAGLAIWMVFFLLQIYVLKHHPLKTPSRVAFAGLNIIVASSVIGSHQLLAALVLLTAGFGLLAQTIIWNKLILGNMVKSEDKAGE